MKRASLKKYPAGKTYYVKVWHEGLKKHYEINTRQAQKRKADVFLDKFLGDYNEWSKQKLEESNPTYLHNAVQAFIKHKRGDGQTSKGTIEGYELALNDLIECCPNPKMDINGLGTLVKVGTVLYEYKRKLDNTLTLSTVNIRLRSVKAFLHWLYDQDQIKKIPKITITTTPPRDKLYPKEFEGLMKYVNDPIVTSWIRFARFTGYRLREIPKVHLGENGYYQAIGKRGKKREINLSDELVDLLHKIQATNYKPARISKSFQLAYRKYVLSQNSDYLPDGYSIDEIQLIGRDKINRQIAKLYIDRYCLQHGLDKGDLTEGQKRTAMTQGKTFHCLRHLYCTEVQIATGDYQKTKSIMAHSSVIITERYTHLDTIESTKAISEQMMKAQA